jgi:hypothetical protein
LYLVTSTVPLWYSGTSHYDSTFTFLPDKRADLVGVAFVQPGLL